jgi:hypothetical protein
MYDSIAFSISDKSGRLRFESFHALNAMAPEPVIAALRTYLVGRPLTEVDVKVLGELLEDADPTERGNLLKLVCDLQAIVVPRPRSDGPNAPAEQHSPRAEQGGIGRSDAVRGIAYVPGC